MIYIDWENFNFKLTENFTVGEFLRYDVNRIPVRNPEIERNIYLLALELQKIRNAYGEPIIITSGYRPPKINAMVNGVKNSQHILGKAVDITITKNLKTLPDFEKWIDSRWYGALGYGSKKRGFVHIDMRNGKGWDTGGKKGVRWNY